MIKWGGVLFFKSFECKVEMFGIGVFRNVEVCSVILTLLNLA